MARIEPMINIRPCKVDDKKAFFHMWVDKTKLMLHFQANWQCRDMENMKSKYIESGCLPNSVEKTVICEPAALVEFEDGTVKIVEAERVIFSGSHRMFESFIWED